MAKKPKNKTYPFSDELAGLSRSVFKEALGRTLIDMDGIPHTVQTIVGSAKYPWRCIINEEDPASKSGYWITNLSLMCQMLGKPLPTKEQEIAFERVARIRMEQLATPEAKKIIFDGIDR